MTSCTLLLSVCVCAGAILSLRDVTHGVQTRASTFSDDFETMSFIVTSYNGVAVGLVLILNVAVIVQLLRSKRSALRSRVQQSNKGTIMILAMTIMFLLLKVPYAVASVIWNRTRERAVLWLAAGICVNLINSSINCVVYLATSAEFRKDLVGMLCPRCDQCRRPSGCCPPQNVGCSTAQNSGDQ